MSCSTVAVLHKGPESLRLPDRLYFPVEVRKSSKENFCCCIPEAGCATTGDSVEALLQSAGDIIADYLEDLQEDKLPFPQPLPKLPVKDEGFVSMKTVEVLLP